MYVITIYTGTTNSLLLLWKNGELVDQAKTNVGVRNTSIDGHKRTLVQATKETLQEVLIKHGLQDSDIDSILHGNLKMPKHWLRTK